MSIELRSEEVQEILTRPPHALIRYGISIICGVLVVVLFIGSFFFRYPDIVQGEVLITTENPPVWLVAQSTGKIKELLCEDKQTVQQGDLLAVIENSSNTSHIQTISRLLSTVQITDSIYYLPEELLTQAYELGGVQSAFSAFTRAAIGYNNFLSLNLIHHERNALQKKITDRATYLSNLRKQAAIKKKEVDIARSNFEREQSLYEKKIVSKLDLEMAEQAYLVQQQSLQQLQTSIALESAESSQMQESVNKLSLQYLQEDKQSLATLISAYRELVAVIENWQQTYFLIASQTGVVTFNTFWKQNQFVSMGDKMLAIISQNPGLLIGKVKVPASGSGKVLTEQTVNIKLSGYPYMEYGVLQGTIRNISLVPNNEFYIAEVTLPNGLRSSTGKDLNFTGELTGIAEIITENRSLIVRIISPLKYLTERFF
jgi:hypothetical protein